ncbi:60s ribosomal protein l7 [Echinococcus multilocularis]|uniref:60s ribosomal protein l7 n=1 Tax=Echinococcus multilocularis TaxID=6211 RepID=A0A068YEF1_ECHMU|nr:60s ribosomal protein l7 [Echinococcus multilocularis]
MEDKIGAEKPLPKLPTIPIKLLKRRKQTNKDVIKQQRLRSTEIRRRAHERRKAFHRPAHFIAAARKEARDKARIAREAKRKAPIAGPERLGIVIRIRGDEGLCTDSIKVLRILNLQALNTAVFVKVSAAMLELLTVVHPYVVWGYADLATVRNLIFKRGKTKVGHKIRSIDNALVESKLGSLGILCIEDIIHELMTLGPHLRDVLGFLCPIKLMRPAGGWGSHLKKSQHAFNHLVGNRDEMISELVHKMV